MTARPTFEEFVQGLLNAGLEPGTPPVRGLGSGSVVDLEACEESRCPDCGHHGLEYHPFYSPVEGYVAIARCPDCGYWEEF